MSLTIPWRMVFCMAMALLGFACIWSKLLLKHDVAADALASGVHGTQHSLLW